MNMIAIWKSKPDSKGRPPRRGIRALRHFDFWIECFEFCSYIFYGKLPIDSLLVGIARRRHAHNAARNSFSVMFKQLPCFGVGIISKRFANERARFDSNVSYNYTVRVQVISYQDYFARSKIIDFQ